MLPLNQNEINQYKKAFGQFNHRLDDNNVLLDMTDMSKLLGELGKTHSETDAKTLFNELEIAADGTGWILDLPTFMVLMLHKGSRSRKRHKKAKVFTQQWRDLMELGQLSSGEIELEKSQNAEQLRYRHKSFSASDYTAIKYPNYQNEYGVEFPRDKCKITADDHDAVNGDAVSTSMGTHSKVNFQDQNESDNRQEQGDVDRSKGMQRGCFCVSL